MLSGMLLKTSDVTKNVLIMIIRKLEHLLWNQPLFLKGQVGITFKKRLLSMIESGLVIKGSFSGSLAIISRKTKAMS